MQALGWEKLWAEIELEKGETMEQAWEEAQKRADAWHLKAHKEFYDKNPFLPVIQKNEAPEIDEATEKEYQELKTELQKSLTYDMALEVLKKSNFPYSIELKKIVMSKSNQ